MPDSIAMAELIAAIPIILVLCRQFGPGRVTPFAMLWAFLLLPPKPLFDHLSINKLMIAGLILTVGVLLFDRKTVLRLRPGWVDLPILIYILLPIVALVLGRSPNPKSAFDQSFLTLGQWGIPYVLGRLYFSDRLGPRRLSIAVAIAALCCVPFCFFEMAMGPGWFVREVVFGMSTTVQNRLGGWRPVLLLNSGLELVTWMALSTITATWLWASDERWSRRFLPAWLPPLILLLTTLACRGVYGYLTLLLGFSAIALLWLTRTKWVLVPYLLLPLVYVGLRATQLWSGQTLVQLAGLFGSRAVSSVSLRVNTENEFISTSAQNGLIFGLGGYYTDSWADGWWLPLLRQGGLLAVGCHYLVFLLPVILFLLRKSSRSVVASAAAGPALFLTLLMIDSLHNTPLIPIATLLGGSLTGFYLGDRGWKKVESVRRTQTAEPPRAERSESRTPPVGHATYRLGDIINQKQAESASNRDAQATTSPPRPKRPADRAIAAGFFVASIAVSLSILIQSGIQLSRGEGLNLINGVLWSWVVISALLFRLMPGRDAAIVSLILGWAILPVASFPASSVLDGGKTSWWPALAVQTDSVVNKATMIGLGSLLGLLLFDRRSLTRLRLDLVDLPILAWCVLPLLSCLTNGLSLLEGLSQVRCQLLSWGVPYLLGRVYLTDVGSQQRFAVGLVAGGLAYLPICLLEHIQGPLVYRLHYGPHPYEWDGAVRHLGHRPLVFLEHGNQLGMWLASSALVATWLWASRVVRKPGGIPGGWLAACLIALTIICQSHGSIVLLGIGLLPLVFHKLGWRWLNWRSVLGSGALVVILSGLLEAVRRGFQPQAIRNDVVGFFRGINKTSFTWRLARTADFLPVALRRPVQGWARDNWRGDGLTFLDPAALPAWLMVFGKWGSLSLISVLGVWLVPMIQQAKRWSSAMLGPSLGATGALVVLVLINFLDAFSNSTIILPIIAAIGGLVRPRQVS